MNIRKLFQALVLGGATLAAVHCGGGVDDPQAPSNSPPQVGTTSDAGTLTDAGTPAPDAGDPGPDAGDPGGPRSW